MSIPAKLVLWILVLAAIVGSSLWLMGSKKKEYTAAIQIDATPESVFPFLTEPEKHKSWVSGLSHVESLAVDAVGDETADRVTGTRIIERGGQESRFEDEVIRFEPNALLSVQSSNNGQIMTSIYQLEPRNGQTYFNYRVVKRFRGLKRLYAPLQPDDTQSVIDGDVKKLKDQVETND